MQNGGGGGRRRPESTPASGGHGKDDEDEHGGSGASRSDSSGMEGAELEAELAVGLDLRGEHRSDCGELSSYGGHGGAREGKGEREGAGQVEEWMREGVGVLFSSTRGQVEREGRERHAHRAGVAWRHGRQWRRRKTREKPPGTIFINYKKVQQQLWQFKRGS